MWKCAPLLSSFVGFNITSSMARCGGNAKVNIFVYDTPCRRQMFLVDELMKVDRPVLYRTEQKLHAKKENLYPFV